MKTIVIFGASGDTGKYFVEYLYQHINGYSIIASGTRETNYFDSYDGKVQYIPVDITKESDFEKLPSNIYAVVDLAGYMPARMNGYHPEKYFQINTLGTLNVLNYCIKSHADRILFAQSFGDIKDHSEENPILTVDLPRHFSFKTDHTIYVISKDAAVDTIEHYHQFYGLKSFVFRLPTIHLWSEIDTFYVNGIERKIGYRLMIDRAMKGLPIEVWGDPSRKKDMVYVKDFCQMLYKALAVEQDAGYYNVGTGIGTTLLDQIRGMVEVFGEEGNKSEIIMAPDKPNAPQYIMDITEAEKELSYKPEYNYLKMLEDIKKEMFSRKH